MSSDLHRWCWLLLLTPLLIGAGGCAKPRTLAYQSLQDARILDDFRLDGRLDDGSFDGAAGVVILEFGRGGLGIGFTVGHGVALRRLDDRWSPPLPLDIVAGSVGFQIGGEGGRMVMIFRDAASFEDFVFEGTQFLAEASGTAGTASGAAGNPLDRPKVEVVSSTGGLYGGAVIGGFGVTVDSSMMRDGYGPEATPRGVLDGRGAPTPPGAITLWKSLGE
ncbi:MAG: lipid-binding SYLF domain-containing protein [Planctomycetota bacterium]|nr:lipid-binding SYLF domain-containing protein [Planctomycetota bacterium]